MHIHCRTKNFNHILLSNFRTPSKFHSWCILVRSAKRRRYCCTICPVVHLSLSRFSTSRFPAASLPPDPSSSNGLSLSLSSSHSPMITPPQAGVSPRFFDLFEWFLENSSYPLTVSYFCSSPSSAFSQAPFRMRAISDTSILCLGDFSNFPDHQS